MSLISNGFLQLKIICTTGSSSNSNSSLSCVNLMIRRRCLYCRLIQQFNWTTGLIRILLFDVHEQTHKSWSDIKREEKSPYYEEMEPCYKNLPFSTVQFQHRDRQLLSLTNITDNHVGSLRCVFVCVSLLIHFVHQAASLMLL